MKQLHFHNMNTGRRFAGLKNIRKLLLGAALGALLLSLGTSAAPQPQITPCQQLKKTLPVVFSFGKLAGAIEMREVMIVTWLASRRGAQEIYRVYKRSVDAAQYRRHKDREYQRQKRRSQEAEAAAFKVLGCSAG